ncbi:isocitrate lyase/PEP mutase family protein [Pseudoalteromonas ulvae]|nr:isocitrate lyase/phosphoenolpyruvate mutase family protein [Pseudoalteromonas ulvae]
MNHYTFFKNLHLGEKPFILPNAWDPLSAIILEQVGFKALGTTSWGMANARGQNDSEQCDFETFLEQTRRIISAVKLPVTVDIESGYSDDHAQICEHVLQIARLGAVGINIEDSSKCSNSLRSMKDQAEILSKLKHVLRNEGYSEFFINARSDVFLVDDYCIDDALSRITTYQLSGADGIFLPGLNDEKVIEKVIQSISIPVNLMALKSLINYQKAALLGINRLSIGNGLSDATISFIHQIANLMYKENDLTALFDHPEMSLQLI